MRNSPPCSIGASVCTGILLFLSFPPFNFEWLSWIAFVPMIWACAGATPRRAAFLGWLAGTIFFLGTLHWLRHVTWGGMIALSIYCALYFIPFSIFISLRRDRWRSAHILKNIGWMLGASAVWVASEYLRAIVITGFPWNLLGVSQYTQLPLIQIAEWGGVYVLSAVIIFVNTAAAITLLQYIGGLRKKVYRVHGELMSSLLLLAIVWSFGINLLTNRSASTAAPQQVALIQPNIPEVGNWEMADPEFIYDRLQTLTTLAQEIPDLDLIIWPETALPDFVRYSTRSAEFVKRIGAFGVPLLIGSMDIILNENASPNYYNASMLFNPSGELLGTYYKQHLVLFGEYIPFDKAISFISALTPIQSSFTAGPSPVIFRLPDNSYGFCSMICFEDVLPYLSRNAARAGATWLINQTNDSWFDPDCGSVQHLANAVFRCIEVRLPMVRCANTGLTCAIDPFGRINQTLAPRTEGFQIVKINPSDSNRPETFYVRYGDLFAKTCLTVSILLLLILYRKTVRMKMICNIKSN